MKLLISDYDGTFDNNYFNKKSITKNCEAIDEFIKQGNSFAISTGRCYKSIIEEINKYSIPYSYIICSNGQSIVDNKKNIVHSSTFTGENITFMYNLIDYLYGIEDAKFLNVFEEYDTDRCCDIFIRTHKFVPYFKMQNIIQDEIPFSDAVAILKSIKISTISNKKDALKYLVKYLKLNKESVFAIGNASNDLSMLKEFNGFRVPLSSPNMMFSKVPVVKDVKTLVKKLETSGINLR